MGCPVQQGKSSHLSTADLLHATWQGMCASRTMMHVHLLSGRGSGSFRGSLCALGCHRSYASESPESLEASLSFLRASVPAPREGSERAWLPRFRFCGVANSGSGLGVPASATCLSVSTASSLHANTATQRAFQRCCGHSCETHSHEASPPGADSAAAPCGTRLHHHDRRANCDLLAVCRYVLLQTAPSSPSLCGRRLLGLAIMRSPELAHAEPPRDT